MNTRQANLRAGRNCRRRPPDPSHDETPLSNGSRHISSTDHHRDDWL